MSLGVVVLGGNWQRGSCPTSVKHLSHQTIHHRFERLKKSKIGEESVRESVRELATIQSKVKSLGATQPDYPTL